MKPIIFTYHQKIGLWNHSDLVRIWKGNWERAGFRAIVCHRDDAKRHPMFGDFLTKIRTFPTINDRRYEEACYLRWLAFEVMLDVTDGRAMMSDYDVFNNGFSKADLGWEDIICHEITQVPCLVEANKKGAREIIEFMMSREPDHSTGHYSDMYAFKESDWPVSGLCQELGETRGACDWKESKTIHAASGAIERMEPGINKVTYIRKTFR